MCEVKRTKTTIVFMFPWGALIGLAGQAVSGVLSTINNSKMQQSADAEAARQKAYYDAKANENPLSRSEVQHVLGQYDRAAQQQIENARGVAAITGATPEFAAAVQKGVAEGRANLMGNVAAGASARKDRYEQLGEMAQHQKALDDQQRLMARSTTHAALAANAASAVGSIMDGYSAQKAPAAAEIEVPQEGANPGSASKLKSATPPPTQSGSPIPHQNTVSITDAEKNAGFTANPDGTYTYKDGNIYTKGWDNKFHLKQ
jgi:hypothetical protein